VDLTDRAVLVQRLADAFGGAVDVTPAGETTPHIELPSVDLPEPWNPRPARALTVWEDWPRTRPCFYVEESVVGEGGEPPRSNHSTYLVGEAWRGFSFAFAWVGDDPVRAIQLWLGRFTAEQS
jgi:hypothetical protein